METTSVSMGNQCTASSSTKREPKTPRSLRRCSQRRERRGTNSRWKSGRRDGGATEWSSSLHKEREKTRLSGIYI